MMQFNNNTNYGYHRSTKDTSVFKNGRWEEVFRNDNIPPEELNTKKKVHKISDDTMEHAFLLMFKNYPTSREKEIFKEFIEEENRICHTVVLYAVSDKFIQLCEELRKPVELVEKREVKIFSDKLFFSDNYTKEPTLIEEPEDRPTFWLEFMV